MTVPSAERRGILISLCVGVCGCVSLCVCLCVCAPITKRERGRMCVGVYGHLLICLVRLDI